MAHLIYLTYGFPPASKSGTYRQRAVANAFRSRNWDVTVIGPSLHAYEWESGLDWTLLDRTAPGTRLVQVAIGREDLNPDIKSWPPLRAWNPRKWLEKTNHRAMKEFPEPYYGAWLRPLESAVREVHSRHPATLIMASPSPYVYLAPCLVMSRECSVPFVIDYRDGWSLNTATGKTAFDAQSRQGRIEAAAFAEADICWFVNDSIRDYYADRFGWQDKYRTVPNGFDADDLAAPSEPRNSTPPLTFGYVGTNNLSASDFNSVLRGWEIARSTGRDLAGAELQLWGHMSSGHSRRSDSKSMLVRKLRRIGVRDMGPLSRADLARAYLSFDALLFMHHGHSYATSGKVFEYMASGLPIVYAAPEDHGARRLLAGYPLTAGEPSLSPVHLAQQFQTAARISISLEDEQRERARRYAMPFERQNILGPAVDELHRRYG